MRVCPKCGLKYGDGDLRCFVDGYSTQETEDPRIGTTLAGRYLIEDVLGRGGMATVYRARQTLVDRTVAVKIMSAALAKDAGLRERFRREARNAQRLAHPNVIEIFDAGETEDGVSFLVMELLSGNPLADAISAGPMHFDHIYEIGRQTASGLARAHDYQIIHRDLKPDNIFLAQRSDGSVWVKILDFGIARSMHDSRLTSKGEIFGTPQYLAPERVTSIDAGASSDLYSLGVILFEMATGRLPFQAKEIAGLIIAHMQDPPPQPSHLRPDIPRRLEELILKLLAKKPEDRPGDAHYVMRELQALAPAHPKHSPTAAPPSTDRAVAPTLPPTTLDRWIKRAAIFEQMLSRAYPKGAPADMVTILNQIRATLAEIEQLRSNGLKLQRKLDGLEAEAHDANVRLGRAVDTLGLDLSQARETLRSSKSSVAPYIGANEEGEAAYRSAVDRAAQVKAWAALKAPRADAAQALREVADALDRWALAYQASEKARTWLAAKDQEVQDLEFQISTLRARRAAAIVETENESAQVEAALTTNGQRVVELEKMLPTAATRFCTPLRARQEVAELFAELERGS